MKIIAKFTPADEPLGKLADVELQFIDIPIIGNCKLVGFAIWERRGGSGRNLTLPARQYRINGESRAFALLRPLDADHDGTRILRDAILQAFHYIEENAALQDGDGSGQNNEAILWEWTGPSTDAIYAQHIINDECAPDCASRVPFGECTCGRAARAAAKQ